MIRRTLEFGWPTLLVVAVCVGLAVANWLRLSPLICGAVLVAALVVAMRVAGERRVAFLGIGLLAAGLWWGGFRLESLDHSVLRARIGEAGDAVVTVTGPARSSRYVLRVPGEVSRFAGEAMHESVLLELPRERAPPEGAVIELRARPVEPRGPETGFDERSWLARRGVHVVLRGGPFRIVGRRGGIGGVADRLRATIASALAQGTAGERRALLEGVVLGDETELDTGLRDDFKASGLYHLLGKVRSSQTAATMRCRASRSVWAEDGEPNAGRDRTLTSRASPAQEHATPWTTARLDVHVGRVLNGLVLVGQSAQACRSASRCRFS